MTWVTPDKIQALRTAVASEMHGWPERDDEATYRRVRFAVVVVQRVCVCGCCGLDPTACFRRRGAVPQRIHFVGCECVALVCIYLHAVRTLGVLLWPLPPHTPTSPWWVPNSFFSLEKGTLRRPARCAVRTWTGAAATLLTFRVPFPSSLFAMRWPLARRSSTRLTSVAGPVLSCLRGCTIRARWRALLSGSLCTP